MSNTIGYAHSAQPPPTNELFPAAMPQDPKTGACPLGSDRIVSHAATACVPRQTPGAAAASTLAIAGIVAAPFGAADAIADIGITSSAGAKEYATSVARAFGNKYAKELREFAPPLRDPEAVGTALGKVGAKVVEGFGIFGLGSIVHSLIDAGKAALEKRFGAKPAQP